MMKKKEPESFVVFIYCFSPTVEENLGQNVARHKHCLIALSIFTPESMYKRSSEFLLYRVYTCIIHYVAMTGPSVGEIER